MIALVMFIPIVGIGLGIFSGFSTGLVFSALAETSSYLQNVPPLAILLTPFGIMEVLLTAWQYLEVVCLHTIL